MVMDIAKAVGKKEYVEVLATDTRGNGFDHEGVKFIKRSMFAYLLSMINCLSLGVLLNIRRNYSMSNGSFIRLMYYWLMTGYLYKLLEKEKYDVVHIHGCSFATELWMKVCKRCGQKYVVTLHGLNSFSDTVKLEPAGKRYERDFLRRVTEGEFPITVISSGIKSVIERFYSVGDRKNITVVCNSFNIPEEPVCSMDIREKYHIPQDAKVLLYIGNIGENKNQRQMVNAYCLLPDQMKRNTWVLFCGTPSSDGSFEQEVANSPDNSHLVLCGTVPKGMIPYYYNKADGVVLLSIAEGFGLSLIEGMHFGLPCAMFKDMDAFDDIYDPCAVVTINNRDDDSVAKGITQLLESAWVKQQIKDYSKRFESEAMAISYKNVYSTIVCKK